MAVNRKITADFSMIRQSSNRPISDGAVFLLILCVIILSTIPSSSFTASYIIFKPIAVTFLLIFTIPLAILNKRFRIAEIRRLLFKPHNLIVALWLALVFISNIISQDNNSALLGSEWGQMGFWQISLCVMLFILGQFFTLENKHWSYFKIFLGLLVFITILEYIGLKPLFWLPDARAYPSLTIGQRGHLAGLFAVISGIGIYRKSTVTILLAGIGIALCTNTSAMIGYAFISVFYIFNNNFRKNIVLKTCVIIPILFFFVDSKINFCQYTSRTECSLKKELARESESLLLRTIFWKASINMSLERPIIGWGNEQFNENWLIHIPQSERDDAIKSTLSIDKDIKLDGSFPMYNFISNDGKFHLVYSYNIHPHNAFLEEIQDHGLIGFFLLAGALVSILKSNHKLLYYIFPYLVYLFAWFYVFAITGMFCLILGIFLSEKISIASNNNILKHKLDESCNLIHD